MSFLRMNLSLLICAAVGLVSIAAAIAGATSASVVNEMRRRVALAREIDALKVDPKNEGIIAAERMRSEAFQREFQKTIQCAWQLNRRTPLMPGIFPAPERPSAGFAFAEAYGRAIDALPGTLRAAGLPTTDDIEDAREHDPSETYDAARVARVLQARRIRCYVGPQTFHVSAVAEASTVPSPARLWFAQVGLWIQRDVVAGIAKLNDDAAAKVSAGPANVEHMPVKHIEALRVLGYALPGGLLQFPGGASSGDARPSFTGKLCNEQYDVVRFALTVVADQRDILRLIDEIGKQNFHQCVGASYSAIGPTDEQQGYLYGTEPVVRVRLEFEAYFARAVYAPLMPTDIRERLGVNDGEG